MSLTMRNVNDYFTYLKIDNRQRNRLTLPDYRSEEFLRDLNENKATRRVFVVTSACLSGLLKERGVQQRKMAQERNETTNGCVKSIENRNQAQNRNNANMVSTARLDIVPGAFDGISSPIVHAAVLLFCLMPMNNKDKFRRDLMFALFEGHLQFKDTRELIDTLRKEPIVLRGRVLEILSAIQYQKEALIIRTLLDTADIVREKTYSKLAMFVNGDVYTAILLKYTSGERSDGTTNEHEKFKTVAPYDALFHRYIATCVAVKDQTQERARLFNQFDWSNNRYEVIDDIVKQLPPFEESVVRVARSKVGQFQPNVIYYVFESKVNFMKHLCWKNKSYNGKRYTVWTYNDCVFDVCAHEDTGDKTWQERLDLIPCVAKIKVEKRTGQELNEMKRNAMLGVSWTENGDNHFRTVTICGNKRSTENGCDDTVARQSTTATSRKRTLSTDTMIEEYESNKRLK